MLPQPNLYRCVATSVCSNHLALSIYRLQWLRHYLPCFPICQVPHSMYQLLPMPQPMSPWNNLLMLLPDLMYVCVMMPLYHPKLFPTYPVLRSVYRLLQVHWCCLVLNSQSTNLHRLLDGCDCLLPYLPTHLLSLFWS